MTLHEKAPGSLVRFGEQDVAGRRIVARLLPWAQDEESPGFRFDPVERRFLTRMTRGSPTGGPVQPEAWRAALRRGPNGPVLVGPSGPEQAARDAYLAAAEGAAQAGRGVYLLDPPSEMLPDQGKGAFVALFVARPEEAVPPALPSAAARGLPAGVLLPLLPHWTDDPGLLERSVRQAAASGAAFACGIIPADDGAARRSMVEARAELDPQAPDDFFERVHHGDWTGALEEARRTVANACTRLGLPTMPPRAAGLAQPRGNTRAAGRLEERAEALPRSDEHRAALLQAAVRWIDESDRDLSAIAREGNFRKIFPFPAEIAEEAEGVLREGS